MSALVSTLHAKEQVNVTEAQLWQFVSNKSPNVLDLRNVTERSKLAQREFQETFNMSAFASALYLRTNEEAFISFQPVISPQSIFEVGLRKNFNKGISSEAALGFDNREFDLNGTRDNPSISTARIRLSMDLWSNFLGSLDSLEQQALQAQYNQSKLSEKLGKHSFWIDLRSRFWNIVKLDEQIAIASKMNELAAKQEKNAQRRYRDAIADLAEVSFYKSQSASRSNQVLNLKFQREQELRGLRKVLPELNNKNLNFSAPAPELSRQQVLHCISVIEANKNLPIQSTYYDELIAEINRFHDARSEEMKRYNDPNLNLNTELFARAVDPSAVDALGEALSEKRQGFQVALALTVPFGKGDTARQKVELEKNLARQQVITLNQNLTSNFEFLKNSIPLLLSSIKNQKSNIESLNVRMKEIKRKYNQGRISISDFISDQDRLLEAELSLKESQNLVIQTLLQYLAIFSQTPCEFNEVKA